MTREKKVDPLFDVEEGKPSPIPPREREGIVSIAQAMDAELLKKRDELIQILQESGVQSLDVPRKKYWLWYIKQVILTCGELRKWLHAVIDSY